jgi:DNA-binding NtrC family response regulator
MSPCILLDAASIHPRDALATLVGDARIVGASDEGSSSVPPPAPDRWRVQPGALDLAREGTLAILDLAALGADAHAALADALRTRRVAALGGGEPHAFTARVVVTLRAPVASSGLPADLARMLSTTVLTVPPLRSRSEDLETLVLFAIDRALRLTGHPSVGVGRDAMAALRAYTWPGNELELRDVLEHAVQSAKGPRIEVSDLPMAIVGAASPGRSSVPPPDGAGETYDALERRILESALERASGNKSEAARSLGLARTTFLDKLRKHGLRA